MTPRATYIRTQKLNKFITVNTYRQDRSKHYHMLQVFLKKKPVKSINNN